MSKETSNQGGLFFFIAMMISIIVTFTKISESNTYLKKVLLEYTKRNFSCLFKEVIGVYRQQNIYNHRNKAIFLCSEKSEKLVF